MMRYLLLALLLLCTSCIQIGSDPQPMHYYLLESMPEIANSYSNKALTIDLELVDFPDYLDRPQIVTNNGDNAIKFTDSERWAEPVQDNLMRIIRENLALTIPASNISVSPWESSSDNATKVKLVVNSFLGTLDGHTRIDIRWVIDDGLDQPIQGHFTDQQPIGNNYQNLVVGLNKGINRFCLELAKKLAGN